MNLDEYSVNYKYIKVYNTDDGKKLIGVSEDNIEHEIHLKNYCEIRNTVLLDLNKNVYNMVEFNNEDWTFKTDDNQYINYKVL